MPELNEFHVGDLAVFQESRSVNGVSTIVDVSFPDFVPGVVNESRPIIWLIEEPAFNDGTFTLRSYSGRNTLMNIRPFDVTVRPASGPIKQVCPVPFLYNLRTRSFGTAECQGICRFDGNGHSGCLLFWLRL